MREARGRSAAVAAVLEGADENADGAIKCGPGNDTAEVDLTDPPAKSC